ncbi:MAG: hypothetical protein MUF34_37545 [Polyangiaceae bacterium]|nr:hypothetical protein [Polyangiaceae bacterium]
MTLLRYSMALLVTSLGALPSCGPSEPSEPSGARHEGAAPLELSVASPRALFQFAVTTDELYTTLRVEASLRNVSVDATLPELTLASGEPLALDDYRAYADPDGGVRAYGLWQLTGAQRRAHCEVYGPQPHEVRGPCAFEVRVSFDQPPAGALADPALPAVVEGWTLGAEVLNSSRGQPDRVTIEPLP